MTAVAEQTGAWLEHFTNQLPAPAWLKPLRDAAFARFVELGFPDTHNEEWRFTNVAPIARTTFAPIAPEALLAYPESVSKLEPAEADELIELRHDKDHRRADERQFSQDHDRQRQVRPR